MKLDEKEIGVQEKEVIERENSFNLSELIEKANKYCEISKEAIKVIRTYEERDKEKDYLLNLYKKQLETADSIVKELCGENEDCYKSYERVKNKQK